MSIKWKYIGLNLLIFLCYFAFYLWIGWKKSGGDMFVMLLSTGTALVHMLILIIAGLYFDKKNSYFGLLGVLLGLVLSVLIINELVNNVP